MVKALHFTNIKVRVLKHAVTFVKRGEGGGSARPEAHWHGPQPPKSTHLRVKDRREAAPGGLVACRCADQPVSHGRMSRPKLKPPVWTSTRFRMLVCPRR